MQLDERRRERTRGKCNEAGAGGVARRAKAECLTPVPTRRPSMPLDRSALPQRLFSFKSRCYSVVCMARGCLLAAFYEQWAESGGRKSRTAARNQRRRVESEGVEQRGACSDGESKSGANSEAGLGNTMREGERVQQAGI